MENDSQRYNEVPFRIVRVHLITPLRAFVFLIGDDPNSPTVASTQPPGSRCNRYPDASYKCCQADASKLVDSWNGSPPTLLFGFWVTQHSAIAHSPCCCRGLPSLPCQPQCCPRCDGYPTFLGDLMASMVLLWRWAAVYTVSTKSIKVFISFSNLEFNPSTTQSFICLL